MLVAWGVAGGREGIDSIRPFWFTLRATLQYTEAGVNFACRRIDDRIAQELDGPYHDMLELDSGRVSEGGFTMLRNRLLQTRIRASLCVAGGVRGAVGGVPDPLSYEAVHINENPVVTNATMAIPVPKGLAVSPNAQKALVYFTLNLSW